jgi:cytochrome b pre-mRNA-processing protein 6
MASTSGKAMLLKHYTRILNRWPRDLVRPDRTMQELLLEKRIQKIESLEELSRPQVNAELRNINALYSLLDNRYTKKVRTRQISL